MHQQLYNSFLFPYTCFLIQYDILYLKAPELKNIDTQLQILQSILPITTNISSYDIIELQNTLTEAEKRLSSIDKTDISAYISIMQYVIMLREKYNIFTSNSYLNYDNLIQQKITILENLIKENI